MVNIVKITFDIILDKPGGNCSRGQNSYFFKELARRIIEDKLSLNPVSLENKGSYQHGLLYIYHRSIAFFISKSNT
jgi:hypothetical protein